MRTTVNIPDVILERAKERCRREGRTLGDLLADGLRVMLFTPETAPRNAPTRLKTFHGDGLRRGIDLDSNAAVLEVMDTAFASSVRDPTIGGFSSSCADKATPRAT